VDKNKGINLIEYNTFLKKVSQVSFSNGKWIKFEYSGNGSLIKRSNSDGDNWDYTENIIYKNGIPYQTSTAEGRAVYNGSIWEYEYEYRDNVGDLRIAYKNENGQTLVVQESTNDPWGLEIMRFTAPNAVENNFLFLGKEKIKELGWYQLGARMYSPEIGRFTSVDPSPDVMGQESLSPYQYGWNNPVLRSDPNGDCPICPALPFFLPEITAGIITAIEVVGGTALGVSLIKLAKSAEPFAGSGYSSAVGFAMSSSSPGEITKINSSGSKGQSSSASPNNIPNSNDKKIPNPNGAKGKPDHQAKVKELEKKATDENPGQRIATEKKIQTEGSNRRPDVQAIDPKTGKTTKVYEAERRPESGRNQKREAEYKRLNIPNETHKVGQ
jgi:RHS repeat-associated protein